MIRWIFFFLDNTPKHTRARIYISTRRIHFGYCFDQNFQDFFGNEAAKKSILRARILALYSFPFNSQQNDSVCAHPDPTPNPIHLPNQHPHLTPTIYILEKQTTHHKEPKSQTPSRKRRNQKTQTERSAQRTKDRTRRSPRPHRQNLLNNNHLGTYLGNRVYPETNHSQTAPISPGNYTVP